MRPLLVIALLVAPGAAAPETVRIPGPTWTVGVVWRHEQTSTDAVDITVAHKHSDHQHVRHDVVEERVLAVERGRMTSTEVKVIAKSKVDKDLIAGTSHEDPEPAVGHTYVVTRKLDFATGMATILAITRDGVEIHGAERKSVYRSAFDDGLPDAFPDHPLAIGDAFPLSNNPKDTLQGTVRLASVAGGVAVFSIDATMTTDDAVLKQTETWRVRIADGRMLEASSDGVNTFTKPQFVDGLAATIKPEHTSSKTTYTYSN